MVQHAGSIPRHVTVEIVLGIEIENAVVAFATALERLRFADFLADVFDHARAFGNCMSRESTGAVNGRRPEGEVLSHPMRQRFPRVREKLSNKEAGRYETHAETSRRPEGRWLRHG